MHFCSKQLVRKNKISQDVSFVRYGEDCEEQKVYKYKCISLVCI